MKIKVGEIHEIWGYSKNHKQKVKILEIIETGDKDECLITVKFLRMFGWNNTYTKKQFANRLYRKVSEIEL